MTKTELIEQIVKNTELTKADAAKTLDATIEAIITSLKKGQKVTLVGFGTFTVSERKARTGRNPRTGEAIKIAASNVPRFVPGKAFKDTLKK